MELNSQIDALDNNSDPKTIQAVLNKVQYAVELQKDRSAHYFDDYAKARAANEVGTNSFMDYYAHHHLDAFNAQFEKTHPGVIGSALPPLDEKAKAKASSADKASKLNEIFGQ
jgi:hypothetical protein